MGGVIKQVLQDREGRPKLRRPASKQKRGNKRCRVQHATRVQREGRASKSQEVTGRRIGDRNDPIGNTKLQVCCRTPVKGKRSGFDWQEKTVVQLSLKFFAPRAFRTFFGPMMQRPVHGKNPAPLPREMLGMTRAQSAGTPWRAGRER